MSASPKIVKVNLLQESKKYQTSPSKKNPKQRMTATQQFSFSEDHPSNPLHHKFPQKVKPASPLTKKLFKNSPPKQKERSKKKQSPEKTKHSIEKIREKYRKMNPNFEKVDQTDIFFKRSIEKLKSSFFKNDKNSKQSTKKILKQIGKYAENRSKKKLITEPKPLDNKIQAIPVQFYGFTDRVEFKPTKKQREQLQKGSYLNFQKAYEISIGKNNEQINEIDYTSERVHYVDRLSAKKQGFSEDHSDFKPAERDQIGERQIDLICEVFEHCEKFNEEDTISIEDLNQLVQQLERTYVISQTQNQQKHDLRPEARFYSILREFEEDFRVIFYRKSENNIYDALFYLRQTNHLQLVCEDFLKIKTILNL